jgi:hypothetical protein
MTDGNDAPGFSFDARRWTPRERVVGGASVILLISLFLPWFWIRLDGTTVGQVTGLQDSPLLIVLAVIIVIFVLLVLRAGLGRIPFAAPPGDRQLLAGAAWLNFLLVLVTFLVKPAYGGQAPTALGWQAGAFIGLAAAAVAAVGSGLPRLPRRSRPGRPPGPSQGAGPSQGDDSAGRGNPPGTRY